MTIIWFLDFCSVGTLYWLTNKVNQCISCQRHELLNQIAPNPSLDFQIIGSPQLTIARAYSPPAGRTGTQSILHLFIQPREGAYSTKPTSPWFAITQKHPPHLQ